MALEIIIIKAPGSVTVSQKHHTFDGRGGTVGRGEDNDLVLEDANRFLSSQHFEIICDGSHSFLVDLSTNGTFVNGSPEPLGKGVRAPIKDGDLIEVGDYQLQVKLASPEWGSSLSADDPFASANSSHGSEAATTTDSPFAFELDQSPYGDAPAIGGIPLAESDLTFEQTLPSGQGSDPLSALDRLNSSFEAFGSNQLASAGKTKDVYENTYSDGASALDSAIQWPESKIQNLIPEEWEDELGNESLRFDEHRRLDSGEYLNSQIGRNESRQPHNSASVDRAPGEPLHGRPTLEGGVESGTPATPLRDQQFVPEADQAVEQSRPQPPAETKASSATAVETEGLLEAMGLVTEKLSQQERAEISREVGQLMREMVAGMMQVLRSRSSIKNEFRMNVTTIQPVENNPLKFSADVDEAMDNMFVRRSGAYKKPLEAVREGFLEISEHQLAMIAGIRHGFEQMMTRFDPGVLEASFDRQGGGGVIPGIRKGRYWSQYNDHYKGFVDNIEHSFQHLFGSDFVHAYEDQLRRLKMARKKE